MEREIKMVEKKRKKYKLTSAGLCSQTDEF